MIAKGSRVPSFNDDDLADVGKPQVESAAALLGLDTASAGRDKRCVAYLTCTHPETGFEVTFIPGEALPGWALDVQVERLQAAMAAEAAPQPPPPKRAGRRAVRASSKSTKA